MPQRSLLFAATAIAVAVAPTARAQGPGVPDPAAVAEVVVTSGPMPVSLNSATSHVEIMSRAQLDLQPPAGLGDTLAGMPGLRSTAYGPGASRPVIRGLSGPRVLILENGVGLVDASALSPDHAVASDPGQATRIEVLRGPSTLAYGGSGIGGVVNVLDERVPTSAAARGVEGRLSASYGTVDDGRSASGGFKAGKGPLVFAADASSRRASDYQTPAAPLSARLAARDGLTPIDSGRVPNSDVAADAYGAGVSYVHAGGFFGASIKRTRTDYGVPFAQFAPEPGVEEPEVVGISLRQTRIDVRGEQALDMGPVERARLSVGHADYRHVEIERETGETGTTFLSNGTEGRLELVQREVDGWQGAVGVQGLKRNFEAIGEEAFVPPVRIAEAGVFTIQRLDRRSWGVEAGARIDRRTLKTAADDLGFTNVSASAGLFARPAEGLFLSLSVAHNRRAPTEFELFADGPHPGTGGFEVGDATLRSEAVNSAEGTLRYGGAGPLKVEAHLFVARYRGFIEEQRTGAEEDGLPVFQFGQSDARFVGAELEAGYDLWRSGERTLTLEGSFDWVRGTTDLGPAPRIPPWSVTGRLVYAGARFGATGEVHRVAAQDRVANLELPTDGYTLLNLTAWVKPVGDRPVRLFVEARNLADVEAREHVSFLKDVAPMAGRSFRAGLSVSF
jgi:iron complex outermembrane receptor protein